MVETEATNGVLSEKMLTLAEVAKLLRVHPNWIRRWTNLGLLKCYRVGVWGDRRFADDELDEFLEHGASRAET